MCVCVCVRESNTVLVYLLLSSNREVFSASLPCISVCFISAERCTVLGCSCLRGNTVKNYFNCVLPPLYTPQLWYTHATKLFAWGFGVCVHLCLQMRLCACVLFLQGCFRCQVRFISSVVCTFLLLESQ